MIEVETDLEKILLRSLEVVAAQNQQSQADRDRAENLTTSDISNENEIPVFDIATASYAVDYIISNEYHESSNEEKEKIQIDSCVAFKMMQAKKYIEKYGIQKFIDRQKSLEKAIEDIEKYITENFDSRILNNKKGDLTKLKKALQEDIDRREIVGNKFHKRYPLTDEEKEEARQKIYKLEQSIDEIELKAKQMNYLKAVQNNLISLKDDAQLYLEAKQGKFEILIPNMVVREILSHTYLYGSNEKSNESILEIGSEFDSTEVKFLCFKFDDACEFFKDCKIIGTPTQEMQMLFDLIAERYRRPESFYTFEGSTIHFYLSKVQASMKNWFPELPKSTSQMANDINLIGEYGDSIIMAQSMVIGIPLVTSNSKDFICDNNNKSNNNEDKRNYILSVNQNFPEFGGGALPYTSTEILSGKHKQSNFYGSVCYLTPVNKTEEITIKLTEKDFSRATTSASETSSEEPQQ